MHRLTEDQLVRELPVTRYPDPADDLLDADWQSGIPGARHPYRVAPWVNEQPDPLNAGWHHHRDTPAEQTTELPAVARQDRRYGAFWWLVAGFPCGVFCGLVVALVYGVHV